MPMARWKARCLRKCRRGHGCCESDRGCRIRLWKDQSPSPCCRLWTALSSESDRTNISLWCLRIVDGMVHGVLGELVNETSGLGRFANMQCMVHPVQDRCIDFYVSLCGQEKINN